MANIGVLASEILGGGNNPKIVLKLIDNGDNTYSLATSTVGGSMLPVMEVPTGVINGVNTIFTASQAPSPAKLAVFDDGIQTLDYTLLGTTITVTNAPSNTMFIVYFPS